MGTNLDKRNPKQTEVRVRYDQILPSICAECGAVAETRVEYKFAQSPSKTDLTATAVSRGLQFLLQLLFVAVAGRGVGGEFAREPPKIHSVRIPFCRQHQKARTRGIWAAQVGAASVILCDVAPGFAAAVEEISRQERDSVAEFLDGLV